MNICFLVTANKTYSFYAVSRMLEDDGYNIFWLSPSQIWTDWLIKEGVSKDKILNIPDKTCNLGSSKLSSFELSEISQIENSNNISLRDIFLMDRILRNKDSNYALRYINTCYQEILKFLETNKVKSIFSEQTWNFEIMATLVCNMININSIYVDSVRVPDGKNIGRFAFFPGYLLDKFHSSIEPKDNDYNFAERFLTEFRSRKQGTSYLKAYQEKISSSLNWPLKLLKHLSLYFTDRYDMTRRPLISLIGIKLKQLINYLLIKVFMSFSNPDLINNKYILIALHREPDSALDVQSSIFLNQFETVKTFLRLVPSGYKVIIKDHSHALGHNSISKYATLTRLHNVSIVNPKTDIFGLIENATLVFSIGGTPSLEAALMGKRSLTASKKFFSEILIRESFNPYDSSSSDISKILNESPPNKNVLVDYLAKVHANSYPGMFFDPTKDEIYSSDENIKNIYNGFRDFLQKNKINDC